MSTTSSRLRHHLITALFVQVIIPTIAFGQLQIVSYNTAGGPRTGLDTVLDAIGTEFVNDIATPIDVLALQEQAASSTTNQGIVDL